MLERPKSDQAPLIWPCPNILAARIALLALLNSRWAARLRNCHSLARGARTALAAWSPFADEKSAVIFDLSVLNAHIGSFKAVSRSQLEFVSMLERGS
jgi:hypothetical protein